MHDDDDPYGHPSDPDEDEDNGARTEVDDAVELSPPAASSGLRPLARATDPVASTAAPGHPRRLVRATHPVGSSRRARPTWHAWRQREVSERQAANR